MLLLDSLTSLQIDKCPYCQRSWKNHKETTEKNSQGQIFSKYITDFECSGQIILMTGKTAQWGIHCPEIKDVNFEYVKPKNKSGSNG